MVFDTDDRERKSACTTLRAPGALASPLVPRAGRQGQSGGTFVCSYRATVASGMRVYCGPTQLRKIGNAERTFRAAGRSAPENCGLRLLAQTAISVATGIVGLAGQRLLFLAGHGESAQARSSTMTSLRIRLRLVETGGIQNEPDVNH